MNAFLTRLSTAAASALVVAGSASAQSTVDMAGWQAWGPIGDPQNSSTTIPVPAGQAGVTAFVYANLNFTAIAPSWQSELRMRVEVAGDATRFIELRPTNAPTQAGTYTGPGPGTVAGGAPFLIPAGTTELSVFVYDTFNDAGQDAQVTSGTLTITFGNPPPPTPPNTCANPATGTVGTTTVTLDPDPASALIDACGGVTDINKPGYVRFVPPTSGTFSASTCGTSADTVIAAMTTCGDVGSILDCDDDACGFAAGSEVTFEGVQGQPVFIAVGLYSGAAVPPSAGIPLTITASQPPNTCENPLEGVIGANTVFLDPAAVALPVDCAFGGNPISKPGYLRFVPPATGSYVISNCATAIDTVMAAMTTCGDPSTITACDDDGCTGGDPPFNSSLIFNGTAGEPVFLAVGLWSGTAAPPVGGIPVQISESGPPFNPCAPENIGTAVLGTNTVTPDAQYPALNVTGSPCTFEFAPQAIARAKYLRFTANATGTYLFEQCGDSGPNADARMGLLTTCGDASTFLICDDDGCTGGPPDYTSKFQYDLTAGQVVFLVVGGYSNAIAGPFNVLITGPGAGGCQPDLNDDGFVNADDLGILLAQWGPCSGCSADFDQNGFVNGEDLGQMLNAWGACP